MQTLSMDIAYEWACLSMTVATQMGMQVPGPFTKISSGFNAHIKEKAAHTATSVVHIAVR